METGTPHREAAYRTRPWTWLWGSLLALLSACGPARSAGPEPLEWIEPSTGMIFRTIPAGRFVMGSPAAEIDREEQERQHDVVLSKPFWMGAYEVTQDQWQVVMGNNPSWFTGDGRLPVERVTGNDVHSFLERLNARGSGDRFRLPTEAEWEYACRAGATLAYSVGPRLTPEQANVAPSPEAASSGRTSVVGSFAPNAWGLYDMHGNVWEWTADEHCPYPSAAVVDPRAQCGAARYVIRGGSWSFGADSARCALRYTHALKDRGFSLGFRVVREPLAGR